MYGRDLVGLTIYAFDGMTHGVREFTTLTDKGIYTITTDTYPFTFNMVVNSLKSLIGKRILEYRYEKKMTDRNIRDEYSKLIGVEPITNPIMWLRTENGWTGIAFEADGDYSHVAFRALAPGEKLTNPESKAKPTLSAEDNKILYDTLRAGGALTQAELDEQQLQRDLKIKEELIALDKQFREQEELAKIKAQQEELDRQRTQQEELANRKAQQNSRINRNSSDIDLGAIFGSTMSTEEQKFVQVKYSNEDIPKLTPNREQRQGNSILEEINRPSRVNNVKQETQTQRNVNSYDNTDNSESIYADVRFREAMEKANQNPMMKAYTSKPDTRSQEDRILEAHGKVNRKQNGNLVSRVGSRINLF